VPGTFQNTAADQAVVTLVAVALLAPFLRYLLGVMFVDTGGSILAVRAVARVLQRRGTDVRRPRRVGVPARTPGAGPGRGRISGMGAAVTIASPPQSIRCTRRGRGARDVLADAIATVTVSVILRGRLGNRTGDPILTIRVAAHL